MTKTRRKKASQLYTTGEINKIIDALLHPLAKRNPTLTIIDGLFHAMIEQDPSESLVKFVRYNSPKMVEQTIRYFTRKNTRSRGNSH